MSKMGRVFSGARPTGRQHLGNYLGAIRNYVALQENYDCVYCIVDIHALTTVETTLELRQNTYEMALDWLAAMHRDGQRTIAILGQLEASRAEPVRAYRQVGIRAATAVDFLLAEGADAAIAARATHRQTGKQHAAIHCFLCHSGLYAGGGDVDIADVG